MEIEAAPAAGPAPVQVSQGDIATRTLAGLAADDYGNSDDRAPLVLLHGLTFDRSMWRPSLAELHSIDPGRRVLALDLPGHGASPGWPSGDHPKPRQQYPSRLSKTRGCNSPVLSGTRSASD